MTRQPPNLLFIMTDHQRADSINMAQCGIEVTPRLNRLAREGTVFKRAYSVCPLCAPARTALATGKYPTANGVIINDWKGETAGGHTPIHQHLADAGYEVGHIGVHHVRVRPDLSERVRFAVWVGNEGYARHLEAAGLIELHRNCMRPLSTRILKKRSRGMTEESYSGTKTAVWPASAEHFMDNFFADKAIAFLEQEHKRPFALFVYLWAPHPPLAAPQPYASLFDPAAVELPANVGVPARGEPLNRREGAAALLAEGVTMDQWRRVWSAHLALTNLADAAVGRILDALGRSDHAKHTLTIFTVDHGDHLGQHAMYQKMELYEPAIRVPLLFHLPGASPHQFDTPVSHLDVMPTLLDFAGIGATGDLDGVSLRESISGDTAPEDRAVFSMYAGNRTVCDHRRAVITRRFKYVYDPEDLPELYDIERDPLEMHNLAAGSGYAPVVREMHRQCAEWARAHDDTIPFGPD